MTTLYSASKQWSERPADERYSSLQELHDACQLYRSEAREAQGVAYSSLRVQANAGEVELVGRSNVPSKMTNWAFGQLAARVGAPASYLRELPATLATQNLNHGLANLKTEESTKTANLLLHKNGGYVVRALTGKGYTRIWNDDITSRLIRLTEQSPEWQPAPAAFDGSRGLYASDHDMFVFLVDNNRRIFESLPGGGLSRGFFGWNSEVGAMSFGLMTFYYEHICGNHMVWGAKGVKELRIRHVGNADDRAWQQLAVEVRKFADASASEDEAQIEAARTFSLGTTKEEVLDRVFGLRIQGLSRVKIGDGFDRAKEHDEWYGDPKTVWGLVNGLTEAAKDEPFADARVELDRAAGKLLQVAF